MELFGGGGEPDIRERPFEELPGLERFNDFYQRNGGIVTSQLIELTDRVEESMIYRSFHLSHRTMTLLGLCN